ncbi:hypothetical protein GWK08_08565 [Leptobacterium flavescens]|uniref:Uncharacterized protein n=1 Tax=Leptobacterium flavescens TaxID=472055 RepID=A0A6P0USY6_9FLAO|nr:hypothetical protein [Leptobacterium flavescens]NER13486.1 hypothetical protein [Leptobacterium flavescens]
MDPKNTISKALPFGRILRFAFGVFFVTEVWPVYMDVTMDGALIRLGWALGLMIIYLLLHLFILKFTPHFNSVIGAILAFGPLLAVFFIGYGGPAATGALTYLAAALLIAAIRGDRGCEVMSVPALFTGKHTHLACLLFSPIDWCESKLK